MVDVFLIFWRTSMLISIMVEHIYIPISSVDGFPFLHILPSTKLLFLIIAILTDGRWYPIVVLICIALRGSDVECLFLYPLAIICGWSRVTLVSLWIWSGTLWSPMDLVVNCRVRAWHKLFDCEVADIKLLFLGHPFQKASISDIAIYCQLHDTINGKTTRWGNWLPPFMKFLLSESPW